MLEILLRTKLSIPPLRASLVPRPDLIEYLNRGLQLGHKLTLISAPAGFGKTTLVCNWVGNLQLDTAKESPINNRCAWLSLDEDENDPTRFLAYLIAALKQVEGIETTFGDVALSMLRSPQPPPIKIMLTSLINEVSEIPNRIVFVLDDYHSIESESIDDALVFLLEHLPQKMHLVIATRNDPNLNISRLRARDQLTELRAADLRFSTSEAAEFLNQVMGLKLTVEDITALERRTEGWIAGLQLAAISIQGHGDTSEFIKSFSGSDRLVLDYLIEEVLEQQSQDMQTFLLKTSVLNRLSGSLCDSLTGQNNGQATLEMLDRANLFLIPLDNERRWYRYHHLFADLLHQRLCQTQPDWVQIMHHQASEWYEQNGFSDEAIEHALCSENFERTVHLIEGHVDVLWQRGEFTKLRRWLDGLPVELVSSKPQLCIFHAWSLLIMGQRDAAERSLQIAEQALDLSTDHITKTSYRERDKLPDSDRMKLRGRSATIRAVMGWYQGDVPGIIKHSTQALEYLPKQDSWRGPAADVLGSAQGLKGDATAAYRFHLEAVEASKAGGNIYLFMVASLNLAITLREQGRLQGIIEICHQQMQLANECGLSQTAVAGWLLAIWGEVLAELNDLDEAIHKAKNGVEMAERGGDIAMLGWSYLCLMRVLFAKGELAGIEEIIQKITNIARESDVPPWIAFLMASWQTRIWLKQDKLEAASQWVEERGIDADEDPTYLHDIDYYMLIEYVVLARFLIAQERLDSAIRLLQRLLEAAETGGLTSRAIEILILQALVFQAEGEATQAMTMLEKAINLAEPGGFIRIFVDEGPPMARLLYEALSRGIMPDYVRQLLGAFPLNESEQATSMKSKVDQSDLIEPLSDREIEVLQLIAEGLTNQEIASKLYLSVNTIKTHTRSMYAKLGVHTRTQAVARGRAFGLIRPV